MSWGAAIEQLVLLGVGAQHGPLLCGVCAIIPAFSLHTSDLTACHVTDAAQWGLSRRHSLEGRGGGRAPDWMQELQRCRGTCVPLHAE